MTAPENPLQDGERRLHALLQNAAPQLHEEVFVYCHFADGRFPESLDPICTFVEDEGLTAIAPKMKAELLGLAFEGEWMLITLSVHSSLDAVGFVAAITQELAARDIPCNVVSAYYHDHLFVPRELARCAMSALHALSAPPTGSEPE